jgi:hypothetical protein
MFYPLVLMTCYYKWIDYPLESHKAKLNYYEKTLEYEDEEGNARILQDIRKLVSMRQISMLQLKKFSRKRCPLYSIQILNLVERSELKVEYHLVLWEFREVFPVEVPRLPLKIDLQFSIDLVPGAVPISRVPYMLSMPKLVELKMQFKEIMEKGYIRPSVSPWGAPTLFVKKTDGTLRLCIDY